MGKKAKAFFFPGSFFLLPFLLSSQFSQKNAKIRSYSSGFFTISLFIPQDSLPVRRIRSECFPARLPIL